MQSSVRYAARKVPEITVLFWVTKLLSTAFGESTSDYFVFRINPYVAVSLGFVFFIIAIVIQLSVKRYIAWIYWLAVSMVAVFGTMAADVTHIQFHVPYLVSSTLFAIALFIIFVLWKRSEGTLSIHSIVNRRRELFYWATVLATFALGTAAGDLTASTLGLGYFRSALIFGILILLPLVGWFYFNLNAIAAFWTAYILTRPLGASIADWLGKPVSVGGLGYGDGIVGGILLSGIVVCVLIMTFSRTERRRERRRPAA